MKNKNILALSFLALCLSACDDSSTNQQSDNHYLGESIAPAASKTLINGDLEVGKDRILKGWTTGGNLKLSTETQLLQSGENSIRITVSANSKAKTEFSQKIKVIKGGTYNFSMSVYHTGGGEAVAELHVGSEVTASNSNLVNQWQIITGTYTAATDATIDVRLNFLNTATYKEDIIVDNVVITTTTPPVVVIPPTGGTTPPIIVLPPEVNNYYSSINNQTGKALKTALFNIVSKHTTKGYKALWTFYINNSIDNYYEKDSSILDMYSEKVSSDDPYTFTAGTDQCGNYKGEGDCYNREHSFPKSWFGGSTGSAMGNDVHHIFATDGKVNSMRSNFPYGEVESATKTSMNGSKLGNAKAALGYTGTVFEPIDEFKGDFARAHFYMVTAYEDKLSSWTPTASSAEVLTFNTYPSFKPWVITMLKKWSKNDPVSQKEIDRNNAAQKYQGNRNPFVDHPEYIGKIWQ